MVQFVLIAALFIFASSTYTHASEGHNGILFKMTQKQVEATSRSMSRTVPPTSAIISCLYAGNGFQERIDLNS